MAKTASHLRFYPAPYSQEVFDGRIERLVERVGPRRSTEIQVDFLGLRVQGEPMWHIVDGSPGELVRGVRVPLRLRFERARWVKRSGAFDDVEALPADHPARRIFSVLHLRPPQRRPIYWIFTDAPGPVDALCVQAAGCALEERLGESEEVEMWRRWSWRPSSPAGLVPMPRTLHRLYSGDPVAIRLGRRVYRHRLFIGGLHHQGPERPVVDHVLNLCDDPNPWLPVYGTHPADRHSHKGEMAKGMGAEELLDEATRVAERLRAGQRVLVHCYAGINRSSTVCCATLMLLEGLSPAEALARVRERHPEATPDPYYWLLLRWLSGSETGRRESGWDAPTGARPLPEAVAIG
jgi:Dual specificity phosphatase, catalytic domain